MADYYSLITRAVAVLDKNNGESRRGTDGRVGNDTMLAIRNFQRKVGMEPADGYAGLKLLARLRQNL
jgi:hypothetical protein